MTREIRVLEGENEVTYVLHTITAGQMLDIQEKFADNTDDMRMAAHIMAASIGKPVEEILALPWTHYQKLTDAALVVNGIGVNKGDTRKDD